MEKITLQDLVHLETESISSSSKQFLNVTTTSSDKKFLSCENTTYNGDALCINDVNQREGGMSVVKVKDLEKYVKHAIESGLLDRQYNVSSFIFKHITTDKFCNCMYIFGLQIRPFHEDKRNHGNTES